MNILKVMAVAATVAPIAGFASAATVDATYQGTDGMTVTINNGITGQSSQSVNAGEFQFTSSALGSFAAFCVDLATTLVTGQTVQYDDSVTLFAADIGDKVQDLFDANYGSVSSGSANDKAAFQIALWETIYDDDFSYSGSLLSTADSYIAAASSWSGGKLWDLTFLGNSKPKSQNLVTAEYNPAPVPLPAAGFLLLGGLGGLGVIARRRKAAN